MKCPHCTTVDLKLADRQGVEIDYCPQCRGVWLDRGELDKIVDRSGSHMAAPPPPPPSSRSAERDRDDDRDDDDYKHSAHRPHKRKSFLGELFDF